MKAPAKLETARLLLAAPTRADAAEIFGTYASDPEVTRYLGWPRHRSLADSEGFVAFSDASWAESFVGPYLIRLRDDGRLLGSTGLSLEGPNDAMTGYVLAKHAWGRGYATEALGAMVDVGREIGLARLFALCHPQHRISIRVLEKCGFDLDTGGTRQIEFPNLESGVPEDVVCYSRTFGMGGRGVA